MIIWDKLLDKAVEISSLGIRVDKRALLKKSDAMDKLQLPYHQRIIKEELPYTIGGGIGQSRLLMLLLEKSHIVEGQQSTWQTKIEKELSEYKFL